MLRSSHDAAKIKTLCRHQTRHYNRVAAGHAKLLMHHLHHTLVLAAAVLHILVQVSNECMFLICFTSAAAPLQPAPYTPPPPGLSSPRM
jgi:hypothetical protein